MLTVLLGNVLFCPHFLHPAFFPFLLSQALLHPSSPSLLACLDPTPPVSLHPPWLSIWILISHLLFSLASILSLRLIALIDGVSINAPATCLLFLPALFLRSRSIFLILRLDCWGSVCSFRIYFSTVAHPTGSKGSLNWGIHADYIVVF